MKDDAPLTVEPVDEYDVDVRATLEQKFEEVGIDASISTYKQPMIVATTRRKVGEDTWQSFKIEMKADALCTQEELDEIVEKKVDKLLEMGE